jgi:hypothetical protein
MEETKRQTAGRMDDVLNPLATSLATSVATKPACEEHAHNGLANGGQVR